MIDLHFTQPHYLDHLYPVWAALPDELRGDVTCWGWRAAARAADLGVDFTIAREPAADRPDVVRPVLVAGFTDMRDCRGRPIALLEHGAGQTYLGFDHGGYVGGPDREPVGLFLCPSQRVADLNQARYPDAQVAVVGCPKLDPWHEWRALRSSGTPRPGPPTVRPFGPPPVVAVSFHWAWEGEVGNIPEARGAWPAYRPVLADLVAAFPTVLGHSHPRLWDIRAPKMADLGMRPVQDFDTVLAAADCYVTDISSTGWEAASVGIPVVWCDAPWYRPDVPHGLRFGPEADLVGHRCLGPEDLVGTVTAALTDCDEGRQEARGRALDRIYAHRDGSATQAAVAALVGWAETAQATSVRPGGYGKTR